jgi:type I restriction enzyme S subunit
VKLPPYPRYKPSRVEWLGDIPKHWKPQKLRWCLKDGYEGLKIGPFGSQIRSDELSNEGYPIYGQENVIGRSFEIKRRFVDEKKFKELSVYLIKPGDLLVTMMGTAGRCGIAPDNIESGIMDSHLIRLRLKEKFLQHPFTQLLIDESKYVGFQILLSGKGSIMHGLNSSIIKELVVLVPPTTEQVAITSFLDRETRRLDHLVAKKQELIERLKEKRTALISRTVTCGLPPDTARAAEFDENPSLKPSDLDWLSNIPKGWKALPLRRSIQFLTDYEANGSFADTKENVTIDNGEPFAWYVRATDLEKRRIGLVEGNRFCDETSYRWLTKTALQGGELLVAKRGEIGKVYVMPRVPCRATLAPNLYLIRLNRKLLPRFAWYWFSVDPGKAELVLADKSTTIGALYKDDVKSCVVLVPPISEQNTIAAYLDAETAKLDSLVDKVEEAIERLQEYRSALITSAMTGKIDVRKAAA